MLMSATWVQQGRWRRPTFRRDKSLRGLPFGFLLPQCLGPFDYSLLETGVQLPDLVEQGGVFLFRMLALGNVSQDRGICSPGSGTSRASK